jgi:hypothetical protein
MGQILKMAINMHACMQMRDYYDVPHKELCRFGQTQFAFCKRSALRKFMWKTAKRYKYTFLVMRKKSFTYSEIYVAFRIALCLHRQFLHFPYVQCPEILTCHERPHINLLAKQVRRIILKETRECTEIKAFKQGTCPENVQLLEGSKPRNSTDSHHG